MRKGYYQIRAEKSKARIEKILDIVNNELAQLASDYMGKELNTTRSWELKGEREGLKRARQVLSDNNMW